jgi:divalent metal cation (Fe/Co/Zn/Cd) transporter
MDAQTFWERAQFKVKEQLTSAKFWALVAALVGVTGGYATGAVPADEALKLGLAALFTYAGLKVTDDALTRRA